MSTRRAARVLGFSEERVRALMRQGLLEPADADVGRGGRMVRWVTSESVELYIVRARRAGEYALALCTHCEGIRYVVPGTELCIQCAADLERRHTEQAAHRAERKREWWLANGPAWRARKSQQEGT